MIKSIHIENFKSHKESHLELSSGVNVIVGPTDSGKSAIIQALRWLINNRPVGDSFRSRWGGTTEVRILTEYDPVSRTKTDYNNEYHIGYVVEPDCLTFKAIKTDVPEEIQKILNLNEINLQTQFESHFLLSKSAGEVASHFNKVAHLDKIDTGLQNIQKWLRQEKADQASNGQELSHYQTELEKYDNLDEIEQKLKELEQFDKEQLILIQESDVVNEMLEGLYDLEIALAKHSKLIESNNTVKQILDLYKQENLLRIKVNSLQSIISELQDIQDQEEELQEVIPAGKLIDSILDSVQQVNLLIGKRDQLQEVIYQAQVLNKEQSSNEELLKKMDIKFHQYISKGKVCPLCGSML